MSDARNRKINCRYTVLANIVYQVMLANIQDLIPDIYR
jgi:hypothetical protein